MGEDLQRFARGANACGKDKAAEASGGSLDSQSVKNVGGKQEAHGRSDAGKKITGRKRHLLGDTSGLPIALKVTAASESDQAGARSLFAGSREKLKDLKKIWVDGTYCGVDWYAEVKKEYGIEFGSEQESRRS